MRFINVLLTYLLTYNNRVTSQTQQLTMTGRAGEGGREVKAASRDVCVERQTAMVVQT